MLNRPKIKFYKKILDSGLKSHYHKEYRLKQDAMSFKRKIIKEIRKEMRDKSVSQSQLGNMVGMSRTDINKALNDTDRYVSFQRLVEMANALKLKIDIKIERVK